MSNDTQQKIPLIRRLRTYFLTGLVVAAPIAITIWVAIWFIESVDSWFSPFIPNALQDSPYSLPGLGVIASLVILTGLGALTANIFGKTILQFGESLLDRVPVIRNIYGALKQIFETVATQSNKNFKGVVLFEYPRKDIWALGFVTTDAKGEIADKISKGKINKFISDNTLINQIWIMDPKKKVSDILKENKKNDNIKIVDFIRFKVGEGV